MPDTKKAEVNPLQLAQDLLVDTRDTLDKMLENHDILRVNARTKLDQLINHLGFINGKPADTLGVNKSPLTPIKDVMGTPITKPSKVTVETLSPDEEKRKLFNDKVDKLTEGFPTLTNEQILDAYKGDQLVIRGVAKRAGLEKYKQSDVAISATFLDDIRTALAAQKEFTEHKTNVDKEIAGKNK